MKAWISYPVDGESYSGVYLAETPGKAKAKACKQASFAGYHFHYTDFIAIRAPEFDGLKSSGITLYYAILEMAGKGASELSPMNAKEVHQNAIKEGTWGNEEIS